MAEIKTIDELDVRQARARARRLQRAGEGRAPSPTTRASARAAPSEARHEGARVILMSHLGRPAGEGFEESFTLRPPPEALRAWASPWCSPPTRWATTPARKPPRCATATCWWWRTCASTSARRRTIPRSARSWPRSAYVNDAFGTAHRAHASTAGVAALLPAYAGTSCSARWPRSRACWRSRAAPSSPFSAARRSPTRSRSSTRCWRRPTPSSSAAACASRSWRPRANPWAPRSWRPIGSSAPAT
ncbi:MAG: phosphoglycerate kinase [Adlercreutzia sp.]